MKRIICLFFVAALVQPVLADESHSEISLREFSLAISELPELVEDCALEVNYKPKRGFFRPERLKVKMKTPTGKSKFKFYSDGMAKTDKHDNMTLKLREVWQDNHQGDNYFPHFLGHELLAIHDAASDSTTLIYRMLEGSYQDRMYEVRRLTCR